MTTRMKDPDSKKDYRWNWGERLAAGEAITAATVESAGDAIVSDVTHTATTVTAWLAGGSPDTDISPTCHVTTDQGREDDWTWPLWVANR